MPRPPFERWTQDQYYQTAAFFAQVDLKADPASKGQQLGATAVEKGKPLYEIVSDTSNGEVKHERTGQVTPPEFPFACDFEASENATRRERLAAWITSRDNAYFARSYVNRLWGYLFGVGIMEPIDDIRAGNPPTNPELLDYLTEEFLKSGFDVRHVFQPDLQVADVPALGRDEQVERGRQDQLLARDRPPVARRGALRRGLSRPGRGLEDPRRRRPAPARPSCPTRGSSCRAGSWRPSAARSARAPASASGRAACSSGRSWPWSAARRSATPSPTRRAS